MQQADVTSQNLEVQFTFYPWFENGNATDNSQYQSQTMPLSQLEVFDPDIKKQLGFLDPILAQPLGADFDAAWQTVKASTVQSAIQSIEAKAQQSGTSISNVVLTAPDTGTVIATVETAADTGNNPMLFLAYELKGWLLTFDHGWLQNWRDTFDVTLTLSTVVPELPFGFAPTQSAVSSNSQFGPNNWEAGFVAALDQLATAIWNAITSTPPWVSDYDWTKQAIQNETDGPQTFAGNSELVNDLIQLNTAGPQTVAAGFTKFVISIENGDQLTATLTHPLDPGPDLQDATNPPGWFHLPPALAASESIVSPGTTLPVTGANFPFASSTQLYLQWPNSATGTNANDLSSELVITGGGASQKQTVLPAMGPLPPGIAYTYTATGLTPGVEYTFVARCRDTAAWSLWGPPLKLTAGQSDTINLTLKGVPPSTFGPQLVGTATLTPGSGDWSSQVVIPASTPPGNYVLAADLNGQTVATMNLTVGTVSAHLDIINPANNQVISQPFVPDEASFTVRGEAFPNNAAVTLTIAGQQVGQAQAVNGKFVQTLMSPTSYTQTTTLTVVATGGGATASTSYQQGQHLT